MPCLFMGKAGTGGGRGASTCFLFSLPATKITSNFLLQLLKNLFVYLFLDTERYDIEHVLSSPCMLHTSVLLPFSGYARL